MAENEETTLGAPFREEGTGQAPTRERPHANSWWVFLPRLESTLLVSAFVLNLYGKYRVLHRNNSEQLLAELSCVALGDCAFFGLVFLLILCARIGMPSKVSSRLTLPLSASVACWSAANMVWLMATGVQIHVNVLANLLRHPGEFGPIVASSLASRPRVAIPLLVLAGSMAIFLIQRWIRPRPVRCGRLRLLLGWLGGSVIVAGAWGSGLAARSFLSASPQRAALAYSSHWFGVTSLLGLHGSSSSKDTGRRRLPRRGERIVLPPSPDGPRPHVVMVVLESTAYGATSLAGQLESQTPMLEGLARAGINFENTRAVITHTTQSQFAMLTGVTPSPWGGFVEAVLVDRPYESLATILRAQGYATRFSQMVRASFECNPGLVSNLGFESFWAREDLQDPTSHLGYFAGDDFRMIGPAFDWFDRQGGPCFMLFMTSVAHHPYEVPSWYGTNIQIPKQAYLHTIRYTDDFLKRVVDELQQRGGLNDTLLCVIADHGEGFGEHGLFLHADNPYDEVLRVPWVISWPAVIKEPRIVREACSILDVTPTMLGLLGYDIREAGFEGIDVSSEIPPNRQLFFAGWGPDGPVGFVRDRKKMVYWPGTDQCYQFDLSADPDEQQPRLVGRQSGSQLRADLAAWRHRNRISFDAKRYRGKLVYSKWQTSCLGNAPWCYYLPPDSRELP